jgi:hypothetical protein
MLSLHSLLLRARHGSTQLVGQTKTQLIDASAQGNEIWTVFCLNATVCFLPELASVIERKTFVAAKHFVVICRTCNDIAKALERVPSSPNVKPNRYLNEASIADAAGRIAPSGHC